MATNWQCICTALPQRSAATGPTAEAVGDNSPSSGLDTPLNSEASHPVAMESTSVSAATITESSESSDEQSHQVTASPPLVSRSPGVGLGLDAAAAPFPPPVASEVEPEDAEVNS